ncbi:uncharacterized protein K02A2.6-like [Octopus bimaculoides]|uniref:uncharacterized protein K02A2.6-like n=1 Tax=Octopus bimaculoides TaxID=37653 RepID=UPI0022E7732C|nr:uncharacterized protein K02A2.6-like [Octopus bimaculoides]
MYLSQQYKEFERLEKLGIIEKTAHSDWAASTIYAERKNNMLRICADFSTGLNDYLISRNFPLPSPEEVFAQLNEGIFFSTLDISEAYLQIQVEECSHLLTINTHRGLFEFKRLSFGVKVTPSIFHQLVDTMPFNCDIAIAYLDDTK